MGKKLTGDEFLDILMGKIESKEQKRFSMWSFFKDHIVIHQDFNKLSMGISASNSFDDEYNIIISLNILFWGIEIMWNSRSNK